MKGDTSDNIYGVFMCGKVAYQKFADKVFTNPKSYTGDAMEQTEFLYQEYMKYCESNSKFDVHAKYRAIGINDFHDLFQFNMALGGIFNDFSLMTTVQATLFKEVLQGLKTDTRESQDEVLELSANIAGGRLSMFGDPFTMPIPTIEFFHEIARD
jgi:hypothetical protein